ncbi:MAG: IclR family transcriptional regulator [Pseudomonadota bacterium]
MASSKSNPLERAMSCLDLVAARGRGLTLTEIVQETGIPQSSAFRITSNLVESRLLEFDDKRKTYSVGDRTRRLGQLVMGRTHWQAALGPVLEALSKTTRETSFFVEQVGQEYHLLDLYIPRVAAAAMVHPGHDFPCHATAAGKVLFAANGKRVTKASARGLEKYRSETVTDPDQLNALFEEVRKTGYAMNDGELDAGVFSVCAPVRQGEALLGAIGIVGLRSRMLPQPSAKTALAETVIAGARNFEWLISQPQ